MVGFPFHKKCSLLDAFQFVEKEKCPLLWREAMKLVIAMPTTVCCEQSFSVTKHTLHANMGMKTAVAKVIVKMHEGTEWMHF